MKIGLRRGALASVLVVAVMGAGAVPGAVASESDTREAAVAVRYLHDELAEAATAGDVPAMRWTLGQLDPLLAGLERDELAAGGRELVVSASAEAEEVSRQIETLLPQRGLPSIPELLNMLLQQLLKILADLINNLLGGGLPLPARQ
jgi:hypothetical protein